MTPTAELLGKSASGAVNDTLVAVAPTKENFNKMLSQIGVTE